MFELRITETPEITPISWNYDELRTQLSTALQDYSCKVYTESTITEAKSDKATLNSLKKAINDEKIKRKRDYLAPFETFEAQVKEICQMIDKTTDNISEQLDVFERQRIDEKQEKIEELFIGFSANYDIDWLKLSQIMDSKWLNKSISMKSIAEEVEAKAKQITSELTTLSSLKEYSFEAQEEYKRSLDINRAIAEGQRLSDIQRRKEEHEAEIARIAAENARRADEQKLQAQTAQSAQSEPEPITEPFIEEIPQPAEPRGYIKFRFYMTMTQARSLVDFCKANSIQIEKIKE